MRLARPARYYRSGRSSSSTCRTFCLQSTFTLSVTVAGLGLDCFPVGSGRLLSGLVVVKYRGRPDPTYCLQRRFGVRRPPAVPLLAAGFHVVWLPLDVHSFRLVLAHGWHARPRSSLWIHLPPSTTRPACDGDPLIRRNLSG